MNAGTTKAVSMSAWVSDYLLFDLTIGWRLVDKVLIF